MAGEQERTGGAGEGERRGDSRGWEPTSPWSRDRPPVCPKNTCEFLKRGVWRETSRPNTSLWAAVCSSSFIHGPQAASCAALTLFTGAK